MDRPILAYYLLCFLSLSQFVVSNTAVGQSNKGIVAVVNDRIITDYDIVQRILILEKSGEARNVADQAGLLRNRALSQLIDDRVQESEGVKENINVGEVDMRRAHSLVERNIRIQKGQLSNFLEANGIDPISFDEKLHAEIVWSKIVSKKILPTISVPDRDIDAEIERQASSKSNGTKGRSTQMLLQVRFDYGASPSDDFRATALKSATALSQSSATCENLSATTPGYPGSQFSDLGDVQVEDLKLRMQKAIRSTPAGKLTKPILTEQGITLFMICAKSEMARKLPDRLAIKKLISRNQIKRRSDRYLRELRRAAIIERR